MNRVDISGGFILKHLISSSLHMVILLTVVQVQSVFICVLTYLFMYRLYFYLLIHLFTVSIYSCVHLAAVLIFNCCRIGSVYITLGSKLLHNWSIPVIGIMVGIGSRDIQPSPPLRQHGTMLKLHLFPCQRPGKTRFETKSVSAGTGTKTGYGHPTVGNSVGPYEEPVPGGNYPEEDLISKHL